MWGENVTATALATAGTVLVALIGMFAAKRQSARVELSPSLELEQFAERITESVQEATALVHRVTGQVAELARSVDKVDGVRERVSVVERGLERIEMLLRDSNNELHRIKHQTNNLDMKVDAVGAEQQRLKDLVKLPVEARNPEKGERP